MPPPDPRRQTERSLAVALTAALVLVAAAGCGGGGGRGGGGFGSGPELNIHFDSEIQARFFHGQTHMVNSDWQPPVRTGVTGTVDPVPQGQVYVRIALDAPVFGNDVSLDLTPPNQFMLGLAPVMDLPAGTYAGTIHVEVFQDAALTRPYRVTGGSLSYVLEVAPELTVSVKIDGVLQPQGFTSSHFAVRQVNPIGYGTIYWRDVDPPPASWPLHPGQVVELEANMPVTWYGPDRGPYGYAFAPPVVTATTLAQTMPVPPIGSHLSSGSFVAMPVTPGQYGTGFVFALYAP